MAKMDYRRARKFKGREVNEEMNEKKREDNFYKNQPRVGAVIRISKEQYEREKADKDSTQEN